MNPTSPRVIALLVFIGTGVCGQYYQYGGYTTALIGDGRCDEDVNNAEWGYDGGDCCHCSCVDGPDFSCGLVGFDCRDPEYAGDEVSNCTGQIAVDALCSTDTSTQWVVNDTSSAIILANATRCAGGVFSVQWLGSVDVSRTIKVTNGTVLRVAGVSPGAAMQAASGIRLFTVINASLELENLAIAGGYATFGGAIAAVSSYISVKNTSFTGNGAVHEGGALYATSGSIASFGERIRFNGNYAGVEGGALRFSGASSATFHGHSSFSTCTTDGYGGALSVSSSTVSWMGDAIFSDNAAGDFGGALVASSANISWSGCAIFSNNTADGLGGALYVSSSDVSWSGDAVFSNNIADESGGALSVSSTNMSWSGDVIFSSNTAHDFGGALYVYSSDVSWSGDAVFSSNTAHDSGGALYVYSSDVSWSGDTVFSNNTAWYGSGGATSMYYSNVSWSGDALFSNNNANWSDSGGALHLLSSDVSWSGDAVFSNNTAGWSGGALSVSSTNMSWSGDADFSSNTAHKSGGALYVYFSEVSWSGDAVFSDNVARWSGGGALLVHYSVVSWSGDSVFSNNIDGNGPGGGALYAYESDVSWSGDALFFSNAAEWVGGALLVSSTNMSWSGDAEFRDNTSEDNVGGMSVSSSTVTWSGDVLFSNNKNGALSVSSSTVSWSGDAVFSNNNEGALSVSASDVSWLGDAVFSDNTAKWAASGGGLHILSSDLSWSGDALFSNNTADGSGGALSVSSSTMAWSGDAMFSNNTAYRSGGALHVYSSDVSWSGNTVFSDNVANGNGGALYIIDGARVVLESSVVFLRNIALGDGGAVFVYSDNDAEAASLSLNSTTLFRKNSCMEDGGALAMVAGGKVTFVTANVTFSLNTAHVAGGAVAVKGSGVGPLFKDVIFISNHAQMGGAAYITSSGAAITIFDRCMFIGNEAGATGGAIDMGAGLDLIINTCFVRNTARAGGGMKVAGITSIRSCTFTENTSKNGEGPAVANAGFVSSITECSFVDNAFNCEPGEFMDHHETNAWNGGVLDVVCKGCGGCDNCTTSRRAPTCSKELGHTKGAGGHATIETLVIDPGYWRATNISRKVLKCYNPDACLGGITGASNYCRAGYEGPYCSTCRDGYSPSLGYTCNKCSGGTGSVVVDIIVAISAILVVALLLLCLTRGNSTGARRGLLESWSARLLPLKIIVIVWQITTQFASVANIRYPGVYQRVLDGVSILNFDISKTLSVGCIIDLNFHHGLFISTLGPALALSVFGAMYAGYRRICRPSYCESTVAVREDGHQKFISMVLVLTFLVYSSASSTLFQMFACDELDDGKSYLRADYRIDCNSPTHRSLQVYAAFMMVVYAAGIPVLYGILLFRNRQVLMDELSREDDAAAKSISGLWKLYKPRRFYYELIECARRILLAGVVVFIFPNSVAQVAVALLIATFFMVLSEMLAPYKSLWDTWINRIGHTTVFGTIYLGLLPKIDVSDEQEHSQKLFGAVLVGAQTCMMLLVTLEGIVITCQLVI